MGVTRSEYEQKFSAFVELCREAKAGDVVAVATPQALGDTYDELIESLNRLADAEVHLTIVPRRHRQRMRSVGRG